MHLIPRRSIGLSHWDIWSVPRRVLAVIVSVELLAAVAVWRSIDHGVGVLPDGWQATAAVLVVAGVISTEASLGVERMRLKPDASPHIDLSSVWAFAAAVLLPAALATAVVTTIYAHIYLRVWRRTPVPPHRVLFSIATIVLAVQAAAEVIHGFSSPHPVHDFIFQSGAGIAGVMLAVLTYAAVNMFLVVGVIVLSGPNRDVATFLQVLGHGDEAVLEFATLSMGADRKSVV